MILPTSRLLWFSGLWLAPLACLPLLDPRLSDLFYIGSLLVILIAAGDAILCARGAVAGIGVDLPELTRLTKGAAGQLRAHISNESTAAVKIRLALALPDELGCEQPDQAILLPAGAPASFASFDCLPRRRGSYRVAAAYVGVRSPLGFWLRRKACTSPAEVRVYPNLLGERKRLAALFLNRGAFGMHAQRQVGQGREFEKLRDYIPGDSYDTIHWKATAKRNRPVTKVFQIERTQEVYVIIDSSRLSARLPETAGDAATRRHGDAETGESPRLRVSASPRPDSPSLFAPTALERCVTAALIMGMVVERQGDLFGVMSFSDRVDNFVRAKNGKAHYRACREALYGLQPKIVTPDFAEMFTFIRTRLRRRALLLVLTSLDDPILAESFLESVPLVARQHLVLVSMIQPPGVGPLFSDPAVEGVQDIYRGLSGHLQWQSLRELEKVLRHRGVRFRLVANAALCPQLVSQYMRVKQVQLL